MQIQRGESHELPPSLTAVRSRGSQFLLGFGSGQRREAPAGPHLQLCLRCCWKGAAWEVCVNRNAQLAQSLLSALALRD